MIEVASGQDYASYVEQHVFAALGVARSAATFSAAGALPGELNGVRYFGKQGGGLGFHGNLRVYPQLGLATVLLANRTEIATGPIDARSDAIDGVLVAASSR